MPELTDAQVMAWYERNIRPLVVRQAWKDWWRICRLIHRGPNELRHCEAIEAASRLFRRSTLYHQTMDVWWHRDRSDLRMMSLRDLPKCLIEHRMRKAGMTPAMEAR